MMIGEPEAILLDEPFSALDGYLKDVLQREMQDFLKDYPGDMILVTHSRDEAYKFCRELSIVHEGRILVTGETKQLFEKMCIRDSTGSVHSAGMAEKGNRLQPPDPEHLHENRIIKIKEKDLSLSVAGLVKV